MPSPWKLRTRSVATMPRSRPGCSAEKAGRRGSSHLAANVGVTLTCSRSGSGRTFAVASTISSNARRTVVAYARPGSVSASVRVRRSNSFTPRLSSSPRTCCATAPCVTPSSSAASRKLRCRDAASKARMAFRDGSSPVLMQEIFSTEMAGKVLRFAPAFPVRCQLVAIGARTMAAEKVAVVSAGGSGIGAAAARRLAADGYQVAILSSSGKGEALAKELGGVGVTGSNQSNEELARLVGETIARWGRVDVLANGGDHGPRKPILEITDEDWHKGMDVY